MKVQQYTDTHLTTLIMTQYVPYSEAQMANAKNMIVNRTPIRTGKISSTWYIKTYKLADNICIFPFSSSQEVQTNLLSSEDFQASG